MGIPHGLDIGHQFVCQFGVGIIGAVLFFLPGAKMYFVYVDGLRKRLFTGYCLPPFAVCPNKIEVYNLGGRTGQGFTGKPVRVSFISICAIRPFYIIFVTLIFFGNIRERLPDTGGDFFHGGIFGIPEIEIPHHRNAFGMGCKDTKHITAFPVCPNRMITHKAVSVDTFAGVKPIALFLHFIHRVPPVQRILFLLYCKPKKK